MIEQFELERFVHGSGGNIVVVCFEKEESRDDPVSLASLEEIYIKVSFFKS